MNNFLTFLFLIILSGNQILAQVYKPVQVTGFNHDVVAEGDGNSSLATTTKEMDAIVPSNYVLCTRQFAAANAFQPAGIYGLPDSGRFSVPGRTFQMAPFDENNVLYLMPGESGILELLQPARYTDFSLLALATEGDAQVELKFQFSDGSTQTFNKTIEDWFNNIVPPTFSGYGRVKRIDGPINAGDYEAAPSNPRFRNLDLVLPCEKTLVSIEIRNIGPAGSQSFRAFILAVSGLERKARPAVQISTSDSSACPGQPVRFVARADSGGSAPVFNWFVNGLPVAGSDSVFTSSSLQNGDSVFCTLESSLYCAVPDSVASNIVQVKLTPLRTPAASLQPLDSLLCEGDTLNLTAKTENCGDNPIFRWYLNGGFIGTGGSDFSIAAYSSGDSISCIVLASGNCLTAQQARTLPVGVSVLQPVVLQADLPAAILPEDGPVIMQTTPVSGTWAGPGIANNVFSPLDAGPGLHRLKAYLPGNNCSDTLFKDIIVLNLETTTLVLGSGVTANQYWTVEKPGFAYSEKTAVEIYNRWGKLVKSFEDYQNDWDASDIGPGCYFFKITYTIPGRETKINKTGFLTFMP